MKSVNHDFDVIVIGSGFGGSVAALRLTEKNYRVAVLEAGKRFSDKDFPKTSWRINKFLFFPKLGLKGIQRIHALPDVLRSCIVHPTSATEENILFRVNSGTYIANLTLTGMKAI